MKTNLLTGWRLSALLLGALVLGAGIASAQSKGGKVIPMSHVIGLINQGNKLHRVVDEEFGVACYILADGRTAPSCVRIRQ